MSVFQNSSTVCNDLLSNNSFTLWCDWCGSSENLRRCGRCHGAYYCCKEHQSSHWKVHKQDCSEERKLRVIDLRSQSSPLNDDHNVNQSTLKAFPSSPIKDLTDGIKLSNSENSLPQSSQCDLDLVDNMNIDLNMLIEDSMASQRPLKWDNGGLPLLKPNDIEFAITGEVGGSNPVCNPILPDYSSGFQTETHSIPSVSTNPNVVYGLSFPQMPLVGDQRWTSDDAYSNPTVVQPQPYQFKSEDFASQNSFQSDRSSLMDSIPTSPEGNLPDGQMKVSVTKFKGSQMVSHQKVQPSLYQLPSSTGGGVRKRPATNKQNNLASPLCLENLYDPVPSDWLEKMCFNIIEDMNRYGICVIDNFLGSKTGDAILEEAKSLYEHGLFKEGKVVNTMKKTPQIIRGDKITWVNGTEESCSKIGLLIHTLDSIVTRCNTMKNSGLLCTYKINRRTKAMIACYPGNGTHYVKHVDNPNQDGRCITTIYYLNKNWDIKSHGGLLRMFPVGFDNYVANIEPLFDRILFFWSDRRNPHEVLPAFSVRFAITVWYCDAEEQGKAFLKYEDDVTHQSHRASNLEGHFYS